MKCVVLVCVLLNAQHFLLANDAWKHKEFEYSLNPHKHVEGTQDKEQQYNQNSYKMKQMS